MFRIISEHNLDLVAAALGQLISILLPRVFRTAGVDIKVATPANSYPTDIPFICIIGMLVQIIFRIIGWFEFFGGR
jgi:hypothetical protein